MGRAVRKVPARGSGALRGASDGGGDASIVCFAARIGRGERTSVRRFGKVCCSFARQQSLVPCGRNVRALHVPRGAECRADGLQQCTLVGAQLDARNCRDLSHVHRPLRVAVNGPLFQCQVFVLFLKKNIHFRPLLLQQQLNWRSLKFSIQRRFRFRRWNGTALEEEDAFDEDLQSLRRRGWSGNASQGLKLKRFARAAVSAGKIDLLYRRA